VTVAASRPTVRIFHTAVTAFRDARWADLITDEEQAALPPSAGPRRRAEHLAGRALLRAALQDWTGEPALSHTLRVDANGRPECVGGPELSVAHSGGVVVCALAPGARIGVDVELPVDRRTVDGIAERYFSAEESRWIASRPERFYMLWVLKEAHLKALGVGLAGGLGALCCAIEPPRIRATVQGSGGPPELALYELAGGFVGIAALGCRLGSPTVHRWTPGAPPRAEPLALVARTDAPA
jgi:4'-phosphopantetheinyl transferase